MSEKYSNTIFSTQHSYKKNSLITSDVLLQIFTACSWPDSFFIHKTFEKNFVLQITLLPINEYKCVASDRVGQWK